MMAVKRFSFRNKTVLLVLVVILCSFYCAKDGGAPDNGDTGAAQRIVILYTNDEHGWMEATDTHGGAAGMMGLWRQTEGYTDDGPYLVLSGGDMWTGPAISTWFRGQSMVEVMNAMHYRAAAIGNHEFDFQVTNLRERLQQANFPFLSANIRIRATGEIPDFASPYIVIEVNGVKVGVIGLSALNTPDTAFPDYVADYTFMDYDDALREAVPQARADGAELLIVIGHVCRSALAELASTAEELGIAVMGGGHCHEYVNMIRQGVTIVVTGSYLENYAKIEIMFNTETDTVANIETSLHANQGGTPDAAVETIVANWKTAADNELSEVIGYVEQEIDRHSPEMYNMITDSWLTAFPAADVSISNMGGVRQSILPGEITLGDIVGVLPFNNSILLLELTGAELLTCLDTSLFVGGMTTVGGYFLADGTPIDNDTVYTVLITDYMYSSYRYFSDFDTDPYVTGVNWRQPLIDWIKSLNTTVNNPLDPYLDPAARQSVRLPRHSMTRDASNTVASIQ